MSENLNDEVGQLLKESRDEKKLPEAPEKLAMKKRPTTPPEDPPADEDDTQPDDLNVALDTAKALKAKEIELQAMEKRIDDKLKKAQQFIRLTEISGKSLAGMPTEKTPEQARGERLRLRFKGTGIDAYIQ